jgi:AcrR family transcriptional regulator
MSQLADDPRVERTREVLFTAVREVAAREGLHAVTAQRLAAATGVSRSTIHRHWPDLRLLLIEAMAELEAPAEPPLLGDLRTDLAVDLHGFRLKLDDHDTLAVLVSILSEALFDDGFGELLRSQADLHFDRLRRVLAAGQEAGELRDDIDVNNAAALLAGPLFFRRVVLDEPVTPTFVDHVVDGFIGAHAPTPPTPSPQEP